MGRRDSAGWYSKRSTVRKRLSKTWCKPQGKPHDFTPVLWVFMAPCCKWWGSALSHCPLGSVSLLSCCGQDTRRPSAPKRKIFYVQDAWSLPQGMPALRFITLMHIWANLTNLYWAYAVVGYPVPPYPILDSFRFFNFDSFTPWSQRPGTAAQKRFCCFCCRSVLSIFCWHFVQLDKHLSCLFSQLFHQKGGVVSKSVCFEKNVCM